MEGEAAWEEDAYLAGAGFRHEIRNPDAGSSTRDSRGLVRSPQVLNPFLDPKPKLLNPQPESALEEASCLVFGFWDLGYGG